MTHFFIKHMNVYMYYRVYSTPYVLLRIHLNICMHGEKRPWITIHNTHMNVHACIMRCIVLYAYHLVSVCVGSYA